MKHEEMMKTDDEYKRTYEVMFKNKISLDKILEVAVKSNGIVGVGIVTLKDNINKELDVYMKGY